MSSRVTAPQVDIDSVVTCFRNSVRKARTEEDLREFEKLMAILSGEELPAEEVVELPEEPKVSILNTLLPPDTVQKKLIDLH